MGGVAVSLHGYHRNTINFDGLIRRESSEAVKQTLIDSGFQWNEARREFVGASDVPVQFLVAQESTGDDRSLGVVLPDPAAPGVSTEIEDLPVLTLARLIETQLACVLGNLGRTHRDLADVVELIAVHQPGREFAAKLHRNVRKEYRSLVRHAQGQP